MAQNNQPKRGRPRSEDLHAAILEAVLQLLAEQGTQGVTYEAVASRSGVGKPTIYLRWRQKGDLISDALESWRPQIVYTDTGNLRENLIQIIKQFALNFATPANRQLALISLQVLAADSAARRSWWVGHGQSRKDDLHTILQQGIERGQLDPAADLESFMLLFSALAMHACLFNDAGMPEFSHIERAMDQLMRSTVSDV